MGKPRPREVELEAPWVANELARGNENVVLGCPGCNSLLARAFPASCSGWMWYFSELWSNITPRGTPPSHRLLSTVPPQILKAAPKLEMLLLRAKRFLLLGR